MVFSAEYNITIQASVTIQSPPFERKFTHALHVNNLAQIMHVAATLCAATTFRKRAYKCTVIRTCSYLYKQPQKWRAEWRQDVSHIQGFSHERGIQGPRWRSRSSMAPPKAPLLIGIGTMFISEVCYSKQLLGFSMHPINHQFLSPRLSKETTYAPKQTSDRLPK